MEDKDVVEFLDSSKSVYSFNFELKNEQLEVLTTTLNGKNVFALLPTGYSKTMCFTLIPPSLSSILMSSTHAHAYTDHSGNYIPGGK
jgi:hypothetical protein